MTASAATERPDLPMATICPAPKGDILIVGGHGLVRHALFEELRQIWRDRTLVGAASFDIATRALNRRRFEVVIIDLEMAPPWSGDVLVDVIRRSSGAIHVIITDSISSDELSFYASLGVRACVGRAALTPCNIKAIIQHCIRGGGFCQPTKDVPASEEIWFPGLTAREQQVVDLIRKRPGSTKKRDVFEQFAAQVGIDVDSAKKYYKIARAKLQRQGPLPKGL